MKPFSACAAAALLAAPAILPGSSTPAPGAAAPAVVPYLCDGGRTASVIYQSGSDYRHARALVTIDGRTLAMRAAPALYGVRYRGEAGADIPLAWSLRGEAARLSESPDEESYAGEERDLVRCVRLRGGVPDEAHQAGH